MHKTALIILNYNNAHDTKCCLESIIHHNTAPIKIIVVDNDSNMNQLERLRSDMSEIFKKDFVYYDEASKAPSTLPNAVLVSTGANLGYGKGNNVGLHLAYSDPEIDYVMILNNDILFVEDIVSPLISLYSQLPECAIISPVLYKKGLTEYDLNCARRDIELRTLITDNFLHYYHVAKHRSPTDLYPNRYMLLSLKDGTNTLEIDLPSGSCMLMSKDFFKSIGSFDPGTFMYFEENILNKKIKQTGKKIYLALNLRCIHLGASTTSEISNKWLVQQAKNSELYYVKNYVDAPRYRKWIHGLSVRFYMAAYTIQKFLMRK